ncbi:MAG: DUF4403 family protein, partial [Nevskiales bacterium]
GKPVIDMDKLQLRVENLSFTRQVSNPLISSASWILQDSLRSQLAQALTLDLGEAFAKARASIAERINRPIGEGFRLAGEIDRISIDHLQPRDEDLLILLNTQGHIAIHTTLPGESLHKTSSN